MKKKTHLKFLAIILCFLLGAMLFVLQSCSRDRSSTDESSTLGIPTRDSYPSRDSHPYWSPDGTRIVFQSRIADNSEIYIMNPDGSNLTRLTNNPARDSMPSWSPDGTRIVFLSNRDGNPEIYTMRSDGSSQTRLTDSSAQDTTPSWSPDGQKIAYASRRDKNFEIFTMNADGSKKTRLTHNPGSWDFVPSWSPDGQKIIFVSFRDGNQEIYVMNKDGSELTRLTDNPADDRYPSWSPDGSRIAFDSNRDGNIEIFTMNADGSNQTRLTNELSDDSHPSWSSDGRKIAFVSDRDFNTEVYVMDADGSNQINLTNNAPVDETFGRSPLPRSELNLDKIPYKIVFESFRETSGKENWEICLIDADGSDFVNLTNTPEIDEQYPHASPDGRRICFESVEGEDQKSKRRDVYIMNIDGTGRTKIAENAFQPCWSTDGRYIAYLPGEFLRFNPNRRANKGVEIYDLETAEKSMHPNNELEHLFTLCWSPDGKWFISGSKDGNIAFGTDDKVIIPLQTLGCAPDISPDGKHLIWNARKWNLNIGALDYDSHQKIFTGLRVVVACENPYWVYHADWSPDANYLTFSYGIWESNTFEGGPEAGTQLSICDLRTGKWTQITNDGRYNNEPDWVPVQIH